MSSNVPKCNYVPKKGGISSNGKTDLENLHLFNILHLAGFFLDRSRGYVLKKETPWLTTLFIN